MASTIIDTEKDTIKVHGRGSLTLPFQVFDEDEDCVQTQRDISADTYYFEVHGADIRKLLTSNPDDDEGLLLQLTRTEVETLTTSPLKFSFVDESDENYPVVEWHGTIQRFGYTGEPGGA